MVYPIPGPNGEEIWPKRQWWWEKDRTMKALENGELEFVKGQDGDLTVHTKQYLRDANGVIRQTKAFSIIDDIYTQHGTAEINEIFGDSRVFTFPKPTDLIIRMLQMANLEENDIVLDFFSGSNATGHALFRFSLSSVVQSKFLLVQLPEPTPKNSYAHEQGYRTVADIGKERIRRVIQGIQTINEGKFDFVRDTHYLDLGFRVFKLTPSHFKLWSGSPGTDTAVYQSQLSLFRDPLVEGWQAEPVVWEISLKEGYPLHSRLTQANVAGHTVYRVENPDTGQQFHITLEASVMADLPRHLNLTPDDLFVCRDLALNDTTAANLALQCRLKTI